MLDEQWSAEAALMCLAGGLSRATLLHDVGHLECGMQSSFESIVLGDALVGWARAFMREVPVHDYSLALEEIAAAGPGGNHLASRYTRRHYREFWADDLFDHASFDRWVSASEQTLGERVHTRALRLHREERAFALAAKLGARLDGLLAEAHIRGGKRLILVGTPPSSATTGEATDRCKQIARVPLSSAPESRRPSGAACQPVHLGRCASTMATIWTFSCTVASRQALTTVAILETNEVCGAVYSAPAVKRRQRSVI